MDPRAKVAALSGLPASTATYSSLRTLALLCVVLPLLLYVAVGIYRYQQIRAETDVRLDRALRIAKEYALKVLDTNETLLARVFDAVGDDDATQIRKREKALHDKFRDMLQHKPQINAMWVLDAAGHPLASARQYPAPPTLDVSDREYFKWHRDKRGGLFISQPMAGRLSKDNIMLMSRGRYAPDGSFAGLVSISLLPSYFEKFHADLAADEPGLAITMLREDGAIFSRWPPLPNAPPSLSPNSPVMQGIKAGKVDGKTTGVSSIDGRQRLLLFTKLGDYPIYMGTGMDVRDITRRWMVEMGWLAAFGVPPLVGLLLALRVALRRTRDALDSAERLNRETLALRRVEEALLQAQKLEALGRLTGGVAHDFNNALMVISNNLYILKIKHPATAGTQLDSIGRAVASATKLTRQLLAFSRRQALVAEHFSLQERLPPISDLIRPVLGSQIQLSIAVTTGTLAIQVDSAEFELALINLAINARDAMPSGGSFSVSARNAGDELPPLLKPPMVLVEAGDTGMGIAPENLDKVFEPFFTTKPVGEGTGLGLSQVYGLCQRAGGIATIQSRLGTGTSVRMFFPASGMAPAAGQATPAPLQRNLGKNVLLVEDNEEVAAALKPVLESMGCSVTRLDRGALARDWLSAQLVLPDLVLSDVLMPGEMDGVALAQHVRSHFPDVHVILMTGYTDQLESIARLGFEIVPKPCSAEILAQAITRMGAERRSA